MFHRWFVRRRKTALRSSGTERLELRETQTCSVNICVLSCINAEACFGPLPKDRSDKQTFWILGLFGLGN